MIRDLSWSELTLLLVPVVCLLAGGGLLAYEHRPYQHLITQYSTSLADRSEPQVLNIQRAARELDGTDIGPGEVFSFNEVVGPRTLDRGYAESNAFMEGQLTRSVGGGICQVSSTVYAAVQETTLPIVERVPHFAVVSSIPPGRDATVWYGKADLKWKNSFDRPLRVRALVNGLTLRVELWDNTAAGQHATLRFSYRYGRKAKDRVVSVYRRVENTNALLSQDVYRAL